MSYKFDRREVLLGAGALTVAALAPRAADATSQAFVTSETGALCKVLVHPADAAHCGAMHDPHWMNAAAEVIDQHAQMVSRLEATGAEVLRFDDLLKSAVDMARRRGMQHPSLDSHALHGLSYVRDFAVMAPRGLLLCNVADSERTHEQALFRFVLRVAPELRDYPVLFDAATAGLHAEGGDIQVLDRHTLLVGVGNHTDARVAPLLARKTSMEVVAVDIRNADPTKWRHDPLRDCFLHLNTSVAQIDQHHALLLPGLFESARNDQRTSPLLAQFGTVTQYRAVSGERAKPANMKLADYLRARGTKVTYVAGSDGDDLESWYAEIARTGVIFPQRERQAANALATGHGALLAFKGADRTHARLRQAGADVCTIEGCEMWRGYGGPHCLTLPLERA